jgi:hypothetical protein
MLCRALKLIIGGKGSYLSIINKEYFLMENRGPMSEDPAGLAATSQCQRCIHFQSYSATAKDLVCKVFPCGVPDKYMNDNKPHEKKDRKQEGKFIYEILDRWRELLGEE